MHIITYHFEPLNEPVNGHYIHAKGLHGLLFNIASQTDREESDWLHKHPTPRPFTAVPLYTEDGLLAGLKIAALTEQAANLFQRIGEWFSQTQRPCRLGNQEFIIRQFHHISGPSWKQLALSEPAKQLGLRFLSPTAFKKGPRHLPLPLPANVFRGPVRIWDAFAPPMIMLPDGWLDWCAQNVFIKEHNIKTVQVNISQREHFNGFVGDVWFEAHKGNELNLRAWQALGTLLPFCGTGHKTTMGMGAVERIR